MLTIDLWQKERKWGDDGVVENIHEYAHKLLKDAGLSSFVTFKQGNSNTEMPKLWFDEMSFDLIFIDGGHSSFVFTLDLINALNLISKGGAIILDDIGANVALREYNYRGPNSIIANLIGMPNFELFCLSHNTAVLFKI